MVDGVLWCVDHVVRHVVEEHKGVLEVVVVLKLNVEEMIVLAQVLFRIHATHSAVLVSLHIAVCLSVFGYQCKL